MLLLASASPARRRLLEQAAIPHCVQVSGVDESSLHHADPTQLVQLLASAKARAVADQRSAVPVDPPITAVLGCDSVLCFEGEVFGKPADAQEAIERWQRMAGGWGELHTGHCLLLPDGDHWRQRLATVTTRVQFARLSSDQIAAYVATGEPLQCAGGFALEGRGGALVERIEGCFSNVIGLSLPLLRRWLQPQPLSDAWREWLQLNRDRGCDRSDLARRAEAEGFDPDAIAAVLDPTCPSPAEARPAWQAPPLADPGHRPRAWKVETDQAQIYTIPALLSPQECQALIAAIDSALVPSTVTRGAGDYRTSRTCHLAGVDPELTRRLDQRLAALIGVDPVQSEPLQGQRYDPGQYFKAHTDWFAPGTDEFEEHARQGGQRTWTVMVYLNAVPSGGETVFERIGQIFTPAAGLALAWNNLLADGAPNHATLHEAMPVRQGRKYVITKWFRQSPGR